MAGVRSSKAATQTQSLRETIAALRVNGLSNERIADRTGLSLETVIGLSPDRLFTPEQDKLILEQRVKARFWIRIAEMIGPNCTADQVKVRYDWLIRRQLRGDKEPEAAHIMCLGFCGKKFHTPDRVRIRRCETCSKVVKTLACSETMSAPERWGTL